MDAAFLVVVGIVLCLLSGMVIFRMAASGASARRVLPPVAELWVAVAVWVAIFRWLSGTIGTPVGAGGGAELRNLASRLWALHGLACLWAIAGLAFSLLLVAHLMWTLRASMCRDPSR